MINTPKKFERDTIELYRGWEFLKGSIVRFKNILQGRVDSSFCAYEYMKLYSCFCVRSFNFFLGLNFEMKSIELILCCRIIYNICIHSHGYSQQMYDTYKVFFEDYINTTVLPSLRGKHGKDFLAEIVKRWANHKVMVKFHSSCFRYLDHSFVHEVTSKVGFLVSLIW